MSVKKLLVAGAGQMGAGIVQVSAVAGLDVVMIDVADEFIQRGMAGIEKGLGRLVEKGRMEVAARDASPWGVSLPAPTWPTGADADLFVEAGARGHGDQGGALRARRGHCATTPSSPPTPRASPSQARRVRDEPRHAFMGVRFFNPVPIMALVEVVRTQRGPNDETV